MRIVGPIELAGPEVVGAVKIPLATFESPLWPSVNRGARVTRAAGGVKAVVMHECMTRSITVEAADVNVLHQVVRGLNERLPAMRAVIGETSRFLILDTINVQVVGRQLYIRFSFQTGDAAGHNMVTKGADALLNWLLSEYPELKHVSVSGNYCTDKKVSAVNGILGRGKYVVAELKVSADVCRKLLKAEPKEIVALNTKKNLVGSCLAGSVRSANAHFANMLLAFYLATGQDGANIIEGSQGITTAELDGEDLYFAVTLPNVIVGVVGNGKELPFVQENLQLLGCDAAAEVGVNARRLAVIAAATVLCGELSLLAALCNRGELIAAHEVLERKGSRC